MIWILGIVIIAVIKTLLCKAVSLLIILLSFWIKGKKLHFNSNQWDNFFLQLSDKKLQHYAVSVYIAAAVISSVAAFFLFKATGYNRGLEITLLIFIGGLAITAYKWHTKGKDYLMKRYREIPKTILETKKQPIKQISYIQLSPAVHIRLLRDFSFLYQLFLLSSIFSANSFKYTHLSMVSSKAFSSSSFFSESS